MHLVFASRGIYHQTEIFKTFLQAQMFPWTRKNLKTGQDETVAVQGALRPILLWEYVFPEPCLDEVLASLKLNESGMISPARGNIGAAALRKSLGLERVPAIKNKDVKGRIIPTDGVALYPIGIKKDKVADMPEWGYRQEML